MTAPDNNPAGGAGATGADNSFGSMVDQLMERTDGPTSPGSTDGGGTQGSGATPEGQRSTGNQQPTPSGGGQQVTRQPAAQQGQKPPAQTTQPGQQQAAPAGDITLRDGTVVKAGMERRWYDTARHHRDRSQQLEQDVARINRDLDTTRAQLRAYQDNNRSFDELGLNPAEVSVSAQFYALYKKDPNRAIASLIADAQKKGINVQIGNQSAALTPEAVQRMVKEAVAPLSQRAEQDAQYEQRREAAARTRTEFLGKHPDASIHENAIATLIRANPGTTPETAYWMLRESYAKRGLDWNVPIEHYIKAAKKQANGGTQLPNGNAQTQQRALPTGRGGPALTQTHSPRDKDFARPADEDWGSIIKGVMKDKGFDTSQL